MKCPKCGAPMHPGYRRCKNCEPKKSVMNLVLSIISMLTALFPILSLVSVILSVIIKFRVKKYRAANGVLDEYTNAARILSTLALIVAGATITCELILYFVLGGATLVAFAL